MTPSRGSNMAGNYGPSRTAGYGRNAANGGYDSNRPPSAQRNDFGGRTALNCGSFNSNRPTSNNGAYGSSRTGFSDANRPGGRTMTTSYAPSMRGGPSVGRGIQRVGSEGFQADRPPSARTMPERATGGGASFGGNRGVSNMALAGKNRSGMNFGPSRFGNAGLMAHYNSGGGLTNTSLGSFGGGRSFSGGSFGGGGSRFGNSGGGFGRSGYGNNWNSGGYGHGGYGHGGYGHGGYGHYGYGHYGYGHGWGYGRGWGYGHGWGYGGGWGYGWGPGWGYGWGGWGGDGWWLLDDLFGLALNATSYALYPWNSFATIGADLIGDGVQALGNLDDNNNYGGGYGDQGSYGVYSNDSGYYDNSNYTYPPYRQPYQPLCGTDYSAENPGCVQ